MIGYTGTSHAQERAEPSTSPALTVEDLATFVDGLIPIQMRQHDIAGAVIAIVKDGKVLFTRDRRGDRHRDCDLRRSSVLVRRGTIVA
jgi:hypothetical protein